MRWRHSIRVLHSGDHALADVAVAEHAIGPGTLTPGTAHGTAYTSRAIAHRYGG